MASNGDIEVSKKRRFEAEPENDADKLVISDDPDHPANLIPSLCAKFWTLGWVTGTGGGCSIRNE